MEKLAASSAGEADGDSVAGAVDPARQTEIALERTRSELRLVSAALMTLQEKERQRIASELHDSIGQALNALSFGIGTVIDLTGNGKIPESLDLLHRLGTQVKETVDEVRRIAMDLRPAILDDLGVVGTLSWFFREFRSIYPHMTLITDIDLNEQDVSVALRTPIYRVVQEAFNNIVKHAAADTIQIGLRRAPPYIHLEVKDNGRGLPTGLEAPQPGIARTGMGLTGMRSRVEHSGGEFHLEGRHGGGTVVSAWWPLVAGHAANTALSPTGGTEEN